MKKIILSLIAFIGLITTLPADEVILGSVPFLNITEDSTDSFTIKYETETDECYIQLSDWMGTASVILNHEQFESFKKTILKTIDWCKIAHDNNSEITKELPDSMVEASVKWNWGVNQYRNASWSPLQIKFLFTSSEGNNGIVTALLMSAPRVTSSYDEEVGYRFPVTFLQEKDIKKFMNIISQENIDTVIKKHEKSIQDEALFN